MPGKTLSYWVSNDFIRQFDNPSILSEFAFKRGIATGNNPLFLRFWFEVDIRKSTLCETGIRKWYPYNKGGEFRKWYGNRDYFINWENDGYAVKHCYNEKGKLASRPQNLEWSFVPNISYSSLTSGLLSFREYSGFINDQAGNYFVPRHSYDRYVAMALLNSTVAQYCISLKNDTLNTTADDFEGSVSTDLMIWDKVSGNRQHQNMYRLGLFETSWDFQRHLVIPAIDQHYLRLADCRHDWERACDERLLSSRPTRKS